MTHFVMCIYNGRYKRRLKLHVVYKAMRSDKGWRIVDESGIEREYHERYFSPVTLPADVVDGWEEVEARRRHLLDAS